MSLLPDKFPKKDKSPSKNDYNRALTLRNALSERRRISGKRWAKDTWAREFRILRNEVKQDEARIKSVLDWFVQNIKSNYVPLVFSAKSFRQKFIQIETASKRGVEDNPDKITFTEAEERLLYSLRIHNHWPKGCEKDLPLVVYKSVKNFNEFRDKRNILKEKLISKKEGNEKDGYETVWYLNKKKVRSVVVYFFDYYSNLFFCIPAVSFLEHWMREVNDKIVKWENWSGNLSYWVFHPEHKHYRKIGYSIAYEYNHTCELWDEMLALMERANESAKA